MRFFKRRSSSKEKGVDPELAPYMLQAAVEDERKKEEEVKYEVKQSTLTAEAWKESQGRWTENTQTRKSHRKTEKYVRQLARTAVGPKKSAAYKALVKLADDLDLCGAGAGAGLLAGLLEWPALQQEFAAFRRDFPPDRSGRIERPEFRLVRQVLQERMPAPLEEFSVGSYRVKGGYRGQAFGFWARDDPQDAAHRYAHMVVRAVWRLWTDALEDPKVKWLRNPAVVRSIDVQLYMLYHALLYRQVEEEVVLRMRDRDGKWWLARKFCR